MTSLLYPPFLPEAALLLERVRRGQIPCLGHAESNVKCHITVTLLPSSALEKKTRTIKVGHQPRLLEQRSTINSTIADKPRDVSQGQQTTRYVRYGFLSVCCSGLTLSLRQTPRF